LTTWISNWANAATGGGVRHPRCSWSRRRFNRRAELESPATAATDYENTIYTLTSVYCSRCHSPNASAPQSPYFAGPVNQISADYQAAIPKIDFTGCVPFGTATWARPAA
jgi:hypothetical protein